MGTFCGPSTLRGRQRFKCVDCGLELSGRMGTDGQVYAYDRAPDNDAPVQPCVCAGCLDKTVTACAEGTR